MAKVYSDISRCHKRVGYCFAIHRDGRPPAFHAGQFVDDMEAVLAEASALALALETLEPSPSVVAFTDVNTLAKMLVADDPSDTWKNFIRYLRWAVRRHGHVEFREVSRKHPIYMECDCLSYAAANHKMRRQD